MAVIRINNKTFHYVEKHDFPSLIFVHGFGSNHKIWKFQIQGLSRRYRIIAGDTPWHGNSQCSPIPSEYSIQNFAHDWYHMIDKLNLEHAFIVAAGMGSAIALNLAVENPEVIEGLVLVNARSHCDDDFRVWLQKCISILEKEGNEGFLDFALPRMFPKSFIQENPEVMEYYRSLRNEQSPEITILDCRAFMGFDIRERLEELKVPILLVAGEFDILTPPSKSKYIMEKAPKAEYTKIAECGGMPFLEKPDEFDRLVINFVDSVL